jgi:hypothetical protein
LLVGLRMKDRGEEYFLEGVEFTRFWGVLGVEP